MATQSDAPVEQRPSSRLDRYFHISERGSTVGREIRGGLATFFTMAYIVVLNPFILGTARRTSTAQRARPRPSVAAVDRAGRRRA